MHEINIEQVDVDGALRETAERVQGDSRAGFLAKAAVAGAGLVGGGALLMTMPGVASAQSTTDIAILNFALTLEFLERDFYAQALAQGGAGSGEQLRFTKTVYSHESQHVVALQKALGSSAIAEPTFDYGAIPSDPVKFRGTSIVLEDTGVRAYKGQAPFITDPAILAAALSIHSVEADHSAWIRRISGADPTYTGAFEQPLTEAQVLAAVAKTGFIVS